jgi:hypothetical protein
LGGGKYWQNLLFLYPTEAQAECVSCLDP